MATPLNGFDLRDRSAPRTLPYTASPAVVRALFLGILAASSGSGWPQAQRDLVHVRHACAKPGDVPVEQGRGLPGEGLLSGTAVQ
jgi:hypothetical protein